MRESYRPKIVVIGGAGSMGRIIVDDLITFAPKQFELQIADFHIEKARRFISRYHRKIKTSFIDLNHTKSILENLKGAELVIQSGPYAYNVSVMKAALKTNTHYVDLGGLFHITKKQLKLHSLFKKKKLTAIIGMGAAPGITNVLARWACDRLERVTEIHTRVASIDKSKYLFRPTLPVSYSLKTILEEFSQKPAVFKNGQLSFLEPMSQFSIDVFPSPIGKVRTMATLHSEIATLPLSFKKKGVKHVTFQIAFEKEFLERVTFLKDLGFASSKNLSMFGQKLSPIEVVNYLAMNQKPPVIRGHLNQFEVVRAIVKGILGGKKVTWLCDCETHGLKSKNIGVDIDTGAPPSIAALMILSGAFGKVGVLPPEKAIPPETFLNELKKRGIKFKAQLR